MLFAPTVFGDWDGRRGQSVPSAREWELAPKVAPRKLGLLNPQISRTKNQPEEEVLGTDAARTSGGHSREYPGSKLRSGPSKSWKTSILARTSLTRRCRRPRPQEISKNFGQVHFGGLNFRANLCRKGSISGAPENSKFLPLL